MLTNAFKVEDSNKQQVAIFMFKLKNSILPHAFHDLFVTNSSIHNYPIPETQEIITSVTLENY